MATRRKNFNRHNHPERFEPEDVYADFMKDLLSGTIVAVKLVETRNGRGNLVLTYDDPNG